VESVKAKTHQREFAGFRFGQIGAFKRLQSDWSYKKDSDGALTVIYETDLFP
jgi:hypothetical protein